MSPLGEGEGEIRLTLPGLKFPTNKEKLMQIAKKHDDKLDPRDLEMSSMLHIVEKLPDSIKTYSEAQLEEEVIKICNTDKKLIEDARWFDIQKVVGCIINKEGEILYPFYLPGFTFPTTKEKIIQYFEKLQREGGRKYNIELAMTRHLPDDKREYNKSELEGELSRVARYKEKTTLIRVSGETMKIVGIVITEHNPWKERLRSTTQLTKV